MENVELKVLAIDFLATLRILRSVAAAQVISQSTKYGWKPTDLMAAANLWGEVGMWEAQVPNGPTLRRDIQFATRERAMHMLRIATQGPVALVTWLQQQTQLRDQYLNTYHAQVASMNGINQATLSALNASVYAIKTARFVANIGLVVGSVAFALYGMGYAVSASVAGATTTAYGGLGTAIAMPAVGLTKSLSYALIKEWNNARSAKVVAFGIEGGKSFVNEGTGAAGGKAVSHGAQKAGLLAAMSTSADDDLIILYEAQRKARELAEKNIAEGERKLRQLSYSRKTAKGVVTKKVAAQMTKQSAAIQAERAAMQGVRHQMTVTGEKIVLQQGERAAAKSAVAASAGGYRVLGQGLRGTAMTVFAVWDSVDAINDLFE